MKFFKNLLFFKITDTEALASAVVAHGGTNLSAALAKRAFVPAGPSDRIVAGWVAPNSNAPDDLSYMVAGSTEAVELIALKIEEKILPSSVVADAAAKRIATIEHNELRRVGRKEAKEIKERVAEELLPRAFSRTTITRAIVDWEADRIVVDTAQPARAELLIQLLRETVGTLPTRLIATQMDPVGAMTTWLEHGAPDEFTLDDVAMLRAPGDGGAKATVSSQDLGADEVIKHLQAGKLVHQLAMTHCDQLSFVLTDKLLIKRVAALDLIADEIKDMQTAAEDAADFFDASMTIAVAEQRGLIDAVVAALGGELQ